MTPKKQDLIRVIASRANAIDYCCSSLFISQCYNKEVFGNA